MNMYSVVCYLFNVDGDGYYALVHVQAETEDTAQLNANYYLSSLHNGWETGGIYQVNKLDDEETQSILSDGDFIGPFTASARTS
jgi:hypothetical protein